MTARPLLLALLLVLPTASAFPGASHAVVVEYEAARAPAALASGSLAVAGDVAPGILLGGASGTRVGPVSRLDVAMPGAEPRTVRDATLVVHEGALLATLDGAASAEIDLSSRYGLVLGLAEAPFGEDPRPGLVAASEGFEGAVRFPAGEVALVPLDAVFSVLGPDGRPVEGLDRQRANPDRSASEGDAETGLVLRAQGPFQAHVEARAFAGGADPGGALAVSVRRAASPSFAGAAEAIGALPFGPAPDGGKGGADGEALRALEPLAEPLNGGLLLFSAGDGDEPARPTRATVDGEEADVGGFVLVRAAASELAWDRGAVRAQADDALLVTSRGVAVDPPAAIGPVPLLSVLLWLVAIGAIVVFFVRRPPKTDARHWGLRLAGFAANAAALALAFWWWDVQFADSFGTSVLTMLAQGSADAAGLGVVLALQLAPWGVAALLVALPVRIALGVGLRYLGKGKSLKGFAGAGGLAALALLGPWIALWTLNWVLVEAIERFPGF